MKGITGIVDSKKAIFALLNYAVITVLMFMGKMSVAEWMAATGGNTLLYFTAETVNSTVAAKAKTSAGAYEATVEMDTTKAMAAMDALTAKANEATEALAKANAAADPNGPVLS